MWADECTEFIETKREWNVWSSRKESGCAIASQNSMKPLKTAGDVTENHEALKLQSFRKASNS